MRQILFSEPEAHLDAIHLASAMVLRAQRYPDLAFATHDHGLAQGARIAGLEAVGIRQRCIALASV